MESRVTKVQRAAFQKRFEKVNADCETRTVWSCIDRPIRPLIFELARIGMIPKFSCCGYSYNTEEEPKTHHASQAYVFFYAPADHVETFNHLLHLSNKCGWNVKFFNNFTWHMYTSNPVPDDLYQKNDGINEAIHQYEGYGMRIECLACNIQQFFPTVNDPVTIIDGNSMYEKTKNWIVKPKQPFIIGVDEYYEKYGKIDFKHWNTNDEEKIGRELLTPEKFTQWGNDRSSKILETSTEKK